jgi:predicted secreted hydrolase
VTPRKRNLPFSFSRSSTGTVYWEGLSKLLDTQGRRAGLGYLEMTGYAGWLRL